MSYASPNPALGVLAKLAIGAALPTDKPLDFNGETLGLRETFVDAQGLRGTRSHAAARVRRASRLVTGSVQLTPTAVEMGYILPYILSAGSAGGGGFTYAPTEALSSFYLQLERGGSRFDYSGCRISRATFHSTKGVPVQVSLDILGVDETQNTSTSFPSLTIDNTTQYFIHEDAASSGGAGVVINSTAIDCFSLTVTIDNAVQPRLVNSQTATVVYTTDRIVTWRLDVPWGDAETLYNLAEGGIAVSATFVNGNTSFSITSPKLQVPRQSPDVQSRDEMHNIVEGVARFSSAPSDEVSIFLDLTP